MTPYRSRPQRPAEEIHQDLIRALGWHAAQKALALEAEAMHLPETHPAVIRSAWATHHHNQRSAPPAAIQEGLIP